MAITHGIGEQDANFAEPLIKELRERFGEAVFEKSEGRVKNAEEMLYFKSIWWGPLSSARQAEFYSRAMATGLPNDGKMRNFFALFAGDLIAYYQSKDTGKQADRRSWGLYQQVQQLFFEKVVELSEEVEEDGQITMIAHSLGTIMALDWLKYHSETLLGRVQNLFLLGSPKAVANMGYADYGHPGFRLPGRFINFIGPDDMVAWPLAHLNSSWAEARVEDKAITVGGPLTSWNAASHTEYWTDNDFTKPAAEILAEQFLVG